MGEPDVPASRAKRAAVAKRRADALELRIAGVDILTIGKRLARDPAICTSDRHRQGYPEGYGVERYNKSKKPPTDKELGALVSEDIGRALRERREEVAENVSELRDLETQRLDKMTWVAYKEALKGDFAAMDRVLRIMERRAKLLGLDQPVRTEVSLVDPQLDAEIEVLLDALASQASPAQLDGPAYEPEPDDDDDDDGDDEGPEAAPAAPEQPPSGPAAPAQAREPLALPAGPVGLAAQQAGQTVVADPVADQRRGRAPLPPSGKPPRGNA